MTNQEKMALLMQLYNAIFQSKAQGTDITQVIVSHPSLLTWDGKPSGRQNGKWFKDSATGQLSLRGFDATINLGNKNILIRIIEQNPNKTDMAGNLKHFANLARQGHRIAWVIDRRQENGFLGSIRDGQWHANQPRATYPAANLQTAMSYNQPHEDRIEIPQSIDEIPDIPGDVEIPDFVLRSFAEDDYNVPEY